MPRSTAVASARASPVTTWALDDHWERCRFRANRKYSPAIKAMPTTTMMTITAILDPETLLLVAVVVDVVDVADVVVVAEAVVAVVAGAVVTGVVGGAVVTGVVGAAVVAVLVGGRVVALCAAAGTPGTATPETATAATAAAETAIVTTNTARVVAVLFMSA
jgi:hypothetical protein